MNKRTVVKKNTNTNTITKVNKPRTIKCGVDEFDIDNFIIGSFEDVKFITNQHAAFPKYKYDSSTESMTLITDEIKITQYGIPPLLNKDGTPNKYIKSDSERAFIKIPLDPSQQSCVDLMEILEKIDEKVEHLPLDKMPPLKKNEKWAYNTIVKEPFEDDDTDNKNENNKKYPKFKSFKARLETSYPEKEITTPVFMMNDNGQPEKLDIKTVTDLTEYFTWGCTAKFGIQVYKIWANKVADSRIRKFGVILRIKQIYITQKRKKMNGADEFNQFVFSDDIVVKTKKHEDDDDELEEDPTEELEEEEDEEEEEYEEDQD